MRIGLVSDTHGLLRPQAVDFLRGSERILHAGDIGDADILRALGMLAPVLAIRGNNDLESAYAGMPETAFVQLGRVRAYLLHDLKRLAIDPGAEGVRVVICGHSHKPVVAERDGVLYVNPGSAGPRRFKLPIAVGELLVDGNDVTARVVELAG